MPNSIVSWSNLPSAGLGNKLFAWAAGKVFATVNDCPHYITGMTRLHLGPLLRGERSKRLYRNYFQGERLWMPASVWLRQKQVQPLSACGEAVSNPGVYVFNQVPHWADRFQGLRDHRMLIKKAFWENLTSPVRVRIEKYPPPIISVHVRMGDFRKLAEGEDFAQVGLVRTPLNYFSGVIEKLRTYMGEDAPVTIFSDGTDAELVELLALPHVSRAADDLDIVHLALMSKSRVLVMSAGSTFSIWAGFLSEAALIDHYQHRHAPIRDAATNERTFEGILPPDTAIEDHPLLCTQLDQLKTSKI